MVESKLLRASYCYRVLLALALLDLRLTGLVSVIRSTEAAAEGPAGEPSMTTFRTTGEVPVGCKADQQVIAAVKSTENGSALFISSCRNSYLLHIPAYSLPTSLECGTSYAKCNILIFQSGNLFHILLPSIRGFMWVDYLSDQETPPTINFQDVTKPCNPTKLFHTSGGEISRVVISCVNLTAQNDGQGSLYYLDFLYSITNNVTTFSQRVSSPRAPIYGLNSLSEAVYADNLITHNCFIDEEMYVFDQSFPLHTPTEPFRTPEFVNESPLEDCSEYHHVDYSGLDRLVVYCTNQRAVVYSMCINEASYHDIHTTGIPYPCKADWSTVMFRRVDRLVVLSTDSNNGSEIEFHHEIVYGKCEELSSDTIFWGLTNSGKLVRVSVSRREEFILNNTCHNESTCLRPVLNDHGRTYSYLDENTLTITNVNSTFGCKVSEVHLSFRPDMYTVHTDSGITNECFIDKDSTTTYLQMSTSTPSSTIYTQHTSTLDFTSSNCAGSVICSLHLLITLVVLIIQF